MNKTPSAPVSDVKAIENEIRDILNWVSVFSTEYDLDDEVVTKLRTRLEVVAKKVGALKV